MTNTWNIASYTNEPPTTTGFKVADWATRSILFRRIRRSMTNGQYIALCRNHEPLR